MNSTPADRQTLLRALDIEWRDHFQTRRQTWKTLEASFIMLAVFLFVDWRFDDARILVAMAAVLAFTLLSGVIVAVHHRRTQVRKFTHIDRLEQALGLHEPGLLDDVHPPREFSISDVFDLARMSTPLFILRMQLALMVFFVVYVIVRLVN